MAEWKKVIVSGSQAELAGASGSFSGSFFGNAEGLTGVSVDIDGLTAGTALHQTQDHFIYSDNGTEKKITFSNVEDAIFGNVSSDITIAAGGAATLKANVVSSSAQIGAEISGALGPNATLIRSLTAETISGSISAASVAAAGALMDSELSEIATVKALKAATISGSLGPNATLIRSLTAATISGSFTAASSSLASRLTTAETELGNELLSSSAQIAADISGAFTAGEGINISSGVISGEDASDSNKGIATFNTANFAVSSGDVTIKDGGVSLAEMADLAADKIIGRANNAGSGDPTALSATQVRTIINVENGADVTDATNVAANLPAGVVSGSITSPSQGTVRVNGIDVDLGLQTGDNPSFTNLTVTGDLSVTGDLVSVNTANLAIEDKFILINSGSSTATDESGIIFGGSEGASGTGSALIWNGDYNSNDGRLAVANGVTSTSTTATVSYYVGGVFVGNESDAATAQADHNGNIRIESNEIYIYA